MTSADEKLPLSFADSKTIAVHRTTSSSPGRDVQPAKASADEALDYLRKHANISEADQIDVKRLQRKIDRRIMPLMFFVMGSQFLDKTMFKYAIIMGLPKDLGLEHGNRLNNVASSIWWAYLITSPFVGLALNKVPVAKFLGISMTLWGIVNSCWAAV